MFRPDQYELIDFGNGRKLERFGDFILDRPSPAAEQCLPVRSDWNELGSVRYERTRQDAGEWSPARRLPQYWQVKHKQISFQLSGTSFGHIGVFPEQAANWDWIESRIRQAARSMKVLNLFAYTGGSTLAAAVAGAQVVHVDAAKNAVAWARRNAESSGLGDAPIRWIVEDATKFVAREVRRGTQYDAVILDPPSYGHGPKGEIWKLTDHLLPLLQACGQLTSERRQFILLTCHSPGFGPAEAEATLAEAVFGHCGAGAKARKLNIKTSDGRRLNAGLVARWPA